MKGVRALAVSIAWPLVLLAACATAVVVLTWPLARQVTTHLLDPTSDLRADHLYAVWALAWQSHALATDPWHVADANIYWPVRGALFYGPPGFGALPYFAPVFLATGNAVLAMNVTIFACVALTAWTLALVTRAWTGSAAAGVAAAGTFLATPTALWTDTAAPQYVVLQYLPVLVWLVAPATTSWRRAVVIALVLAVQALTDLVYVGPSLFLTIGILAAWRLVRPATRAAGVRLALALGAALVLLTPFLWGYVQVRLANPHLPLQTVWPGAGPGWRPKTWLPRNGPLAVPAAPLVVAALGLAVRGAASRVGSARDRALWSVWAQSALWLAVGLTISWLGLRTLYAALPGGWKTLVRMPYRLGYGGLTGVALLSGLGVAALGAVAASRLPRGLGPFASPAVCVLLLAALVRGYPMPTSLPLYEPPAPGPELEVLRQGRGPVLELPAAKWPEFHARAMLRSIAHWRPLLNGYASYFPADFPRRMQMAAGLPARGAVDALRQETGVETIVVRLDEFLVFGERYAWKHTVAVGERPDLVLRYRDAHVLVFDVHEWPGS